MKFLIAGGSGFIGTALIKHILESGDEAVLLTRNTNKKNKFDGHSKFVKINYNDEKLISEFKEAGVVINLSGSPISKRWTEKHKIELLKSRVESTRKVISAIKDSGNYSLVFISASAVGYYGYSEEKEFNETSPPGKGFLSLICVNWEHEALRAKEFGIRTVILRMGIVLSKQGGAFPKIAVPFKFFIGGKIGSGRQWISWIHIDDLIQIIYWTAFNKNIDGVINAVSPSSLKMSDFAHAIGKILKRPSVFKIPEFFIKFLLKEGGDIVLKGQKVLPKKVLENGFKFKKVDIYTALKDILA